MRAVFIGILWKVLFLKWSWNGYNLAQGQIQFSGMDMATSKYNPRTLMEKAIEVMRESIHEPREDNKSNPHVGAVIYKPDGTMETASRGELRQGDHAEFTLLERKNRQNKLDGSKLFATLEPCAPGARTPPKKSCAERIVLARIKEVWIGIEDPDPKVDRKGIKYLQENGVTVHMFDRDLQEIIRKVNYGFIEQALERATVAEEEVEEITLSTMENSIDTMAIGDFSKDALEQYRAIAKIKDKIESPAFSRRLLHQGLLKKENGDQLVPTGFGILLFGKEPRLIMQQAGLLGTIHYPDGREEIMNFDGPMVFIPYKLEKWLKDKLPNVIDRSSMQRREISPLPFELIREAVVNALIHRDYDIEGAKCQIVVDSNTIIVKSPGGPLAPITLEQLQKFDAPMLSRNPKLHYIFAKMDLAEERGFGIKTLRKSTEKAGLPLPQYSFNDPYLQLTLFRHPESATAVLRPEVIESLNKDERSGWEYLSTQTTTSKREYADHMKFDDRKAQRHLKKFVGLGLICRIGSGRATAYGI
ncbi:MAG: ATP-binding protein, partial [Planctomycetota bacterium]